MNSKIVKDYMVPLAEYATVSEEATLFEAVLALEEAQKKFITNRYQHRGILVYDANQKIIGKISQHDVLSALEPQYKKMGMTSLTRFGMNRDFLRTMYEQFDILHQPLDDICRKASRLKVKNFMSKPAEGDYINDDASLNEAIHQLVMMHLQSLLVTHDDEIVGILRLTDVFAEVCESMKKCEM